MENLEKIFSEAEKRNMTYGLYTGKIRRQKNTLFGYCIMWGEERDLQGEYFTEQTDIRRLDKVTPITILADGKFVVVGQATLTRDEFGIFATGELTVDKHSPVQYIDAIHSLVDKDTAYFTTSATFSEYEEGTSHVDENGAITFWPIYSIHITVTPADPR